MTTPAQPSSTILRFLLPSVRDIVFIFLFWSVLAGSLANRPLADPDIGWHIRMGERILDTHTLPRTDPFSSTMQGQPWFAWEWLYDAGLGVLHRTCGLNGVVWLCAALFAGIFMVLLSQLLIRGTSLLLAVVLMLLAEAASMIHLYARPHIVSWLFCLLWFIVLEKWETWEPSAQGKLPALVPWFFPISMVLWVNLHGGWLFGLALLGTYVCAGYLDSFRATDAFAAIRMRHRACAMASSWLGSAAATFVNPYGWRLHAHIYHYLGDRYLMNHIDEFRSPNFHGWAERCFAAILILVVIAFAGKQLSGTRGKVRLSHLFVVLLATYAGFYSSRNLPISSMLLVLVIGPMLWRDTESLADRSSAWKWLRGAARRVSAFSGRMSAQETQLRGHLWAVVSVTVGLVICLHGGFLGSRQLVHAQFDPKKLPVAAVDFLQSETEYEPPITEPIFSTDSWGGYLIYRLYPERKVIVDDRHDLYGSGRVRQLLILMQGEAGWRGVLEDWKIRTLVLPADSTLVNLLRELPGEWRVSYEDRVAVVLERR